LAPRRCQEHRQRDRVPRRAHPMRFMSLSARSWVSCAWRRYSCVSLPLLPEHRGSNTRSRCCACVCMRCRYWSWSFVTCGWHTSVTSIRETVRADASRIISAAHPSVSLYRCLCLHLSLRCGACCRCLSWRQVHRCVAQPHAVRRRCPCFRAAPAWLQQERSCGAAPHPAVAVAGSVHDPCRVVSCRVVSCRVVSCRVVSCRVVSSRLVAWCVAATMQRRSAVCRLSA
jgi:hypothetical protein